MIDIRMPRLSDTMTEGAITTWHKQPGDPIAPGDVLVDIETDKAVMQHEAYEAGTLAEILVPEGRSAPIGAPIARLDDGGGEATNRPADSREPAVPHAPATGGATTGRAPTGRAPRAPRGAPEDRGERRAATPLVRKLARERGIDLAGVAGTGPGGRIVRADLDALPDQSPPGPTPAGASAVTASAAPDQDPRGPRAVPFDAVRQSIAARLTGSATTIPTFTATASARVDDLLALRTQINSAYRGTGTKVSVNDLIVRAVALALRAHPGINASYSPDGRGQTLIHDRVHIGVAVASPAGLVVPVVRDADGASVTAISATTRELVDKAAHRTLTTDEMRHGTFTISNLGMYGIEHFDAIINPPQAAILAVGSTRAELTLAGSDVVTSTRMRYTLTADHRVIDGALAARFLATLTDLFEHPLRLVA
ncbi:dihydrolipoamide acetyltransferase family protein [Rugosimonospora acidiphila]|uniref:Dihydrolipoamide acetyltransferase component of pyruvate dehydrogenase complex n=1 Tax=Rugosimonospora acidiphila TaxID=556531 RepID=A0ABP9SB18_9ACTN